MNADDRLSLDPLGRVEGGNRIVEGSHVADVYPQPTNPDPLDDLTQLARSGTTTKSIVRPPEGRASVGPVTVTSVPPARIRPADRFPMSPPMTSKTRSTSLTSSRGVVIEVDELLCAEVESRLTAASAPGADDVRAGLTCELARVLACKVAAPTFAQDG